MIKDKKLLTIFFIVFIDLLGFGLILPLLPYISEKYGAGPFEIGILSATYSFFQFIAAPVLGRLSDRYGRKILLVISQVGTTLGFLVLGLAGNLFFIFIARMIDGITGGNISIAQAYIADVTKPEDRARGMGLLSAAFGLGFIIGPAAGGILSRYGFSVPAFFAAGVSLITVLATALFLQETVDIKKTQTSPQAKFNLNELRKIILTYPIGLLIIIFFILNFALSLFQGNFALWGEKSLGLGPKTIGIFFAYIGFLAVLIQLFLLPFMAKIFKEKKTLRLAMPILALGLFLLPLAKSRASFLFVIPLISMGTGISNPSIQALASENVVKEEQGGTMGILQSAGSLARILGPALGGLLFTLFGRNLPMIFGGFLAIIIYLILKAALK